MADVSVNSAALDKLSASLEGQTIALKALTESNQRAILQKDETVNISGVATRGGGVRPYDEVTANAIASGNQPLVDALNKDKEPGILSKLLKGILIGGAGYLIFKGITNSPKLKELFTTGADAIKNFFVGDNGILKRAYDFLFKEGEGEDAGILRRMGRALVNLLPEGLVTIFTDTLNKVKEFITNLPSLTTVLGETFNNLKTKAGEFFSTTFESLKKRVSELFNGLMETTVTPYFMDILLPRLKNYIVGEDGLIKQLKDKIPELRKLLQDEFNIFIKNMSTRLSNSLNEMIDKLGLRGLIDKFGGVKDTVDDVKMKVANAKVAIDQTTAVIKNAPEVLKEGLRSIPGLGSFFKQQGGPVAAGLSYTIGEDGPETFIPSGNGTILPSIVKPIEKLGDDIVTELSSGSIVRGLDSLGDKMDNLAASMAGGPGVVTVPGAEGPGTNYNGVYEQRSLVR